MIFSQEVEELFKQFQVRLTGENGEKYCTTSCNTFMFTGFAGIVYALFGSSTLITQDMRSILFPKL